MKKKLIPFLLSFLVLSGFTFLNIAQSDQQEDPASLADPKITAPKEVFLVTPDIHDTEGNPLSDAENTSELASPLPDSSFKLIISGDAMSHENSWRSAQKEDGSFDYLPQYEGIQHLLNAGDLTLVNLETPASGEEYGYRGFPKFNAPINLLETLKNVGVDLVITANNHVLDNGMAGMKSFLDNLDEVGLYHTGAARSKEEAATPFILNINGIQTGFASSTTLVKMTVPEEYAVPVNKKKVIREKIRSLREAGAELIVFHIHWGKEYTESPSQPQMDLYRVLEEEGVDIVIGSHPHRLQPMEIRPINYEGKVKNQAVIWSTANMSWGGTQRYDYVNTGAVFQIDVERKNGQIVIRDMDYDLIYNLNTKTVNGVKFIRLIPEVDAELYRESHPNEYQKMLSEFEWAHENLKQSVDVQYSK